MKLSNVLFKTLKYSNQVVIASMRDVPVVLITGATRGIGRAIFNRFSGNGFSCIAIGSKVQSITNLNHSKDFLTQSANQNHGAMAVNLSDWPNWTNRNTFNGFQCKNGKVSAIDNIPLFGLIDVWNDEAQNDIRFYLDTVINCAGLTQGSLSVKTTTQEMQDLVNVNLMSCISICNMTTKRMIKEKSRSPKMIKNIFNISSILGQQQKILTGTSLYSATKSALSQYSRVLDKELLRYKIKVTPLELNLVPETDMVKNLKDTTELDKMMSDSNIEIQTLTEIADMVLQKRIESNQQL